MITVVVAQDDDDELAAFEDDLKTESNAVPSSARPAIQAAPSQLMLRVLLWVGVTIAGLALVVYGLGPYFQQRDQRRLFDDYRLRIEQSANQATGLAGIEVPTKAPEPGSAVGLLEIGALQLQQVTVEGVSPSNTAVGPGHVPGTAGLGQPGNSVIVGRQGAFGGPFGGLSEVHPDDAILVTTTQGQSVYKVISVRAMSLAESRPGGSEGGAAARDASPTTADASGPDGSVPGLSGADPPAADVIAVDDLYGRMADNRLTLVTSASGSPLNSSRATVVVAKLEGQALAPTPQGGRTDAQTGLTGDATAWAAIALALLGYGAAVAAAVMLYRRSTPRSAYLLTAPPLIAFTILAAEAVARLLPSWT